jgi:hypothetical protein
MASRTVEFSAGVGLALGSVPWNTSNVKRKDVDWLPKPTHPIGKCPSCKTQIPIDTLWYRFLREIAENKLGGSQGQSVAQVATTVTQTQTLVTAATGKVAETIAYARSIDDRASALVQVATDNALAGTSSVPPPSTPPSGTIEP